MMRRTMLFLLPLFLIGFIGQASAELAPAIPAVAANAYAKAPAATPAATAADFTAHPAEATAAADKQAAKTDAAAAADASTLGSRVIGYLELAGSILAGVVGVLLPLAKFIPVGGPIGSGIHMLVDLATGILQTKLQQQAAAQQAVHAGGFQDLVKAVQTLDNNDTIKSLKAELLAKAPSEVRDAINLVVAKLEAQGIDHA